MSEVQWCLVDAAMHAESSFSNSVTDKQFCRFHIVHQARNTYIFLVNDTGY